MLYLTNETFDAQIAQWVTLVDFFASRCGPCKMLDVMVTRLDQKEEYKGKVTIAKVDTDEQKYLSGICNIRSLPTIIIFKDGQVHSRLVGLQQPDVYLEALDDAIGEG